MSTRAAPPTPEAPPAASAEQLLRRLEWTVLRRLDGLLQGDYRTLWRGFGIDLADLREYQYHDDVRHIDWNVTARMQQPYVRQFTEDRELAAWFLLDLSPSIDFGSGERSKGAVSSEFVGVLARLLTGHGNRVGALLYGNSVDTVLPARNGRRHVLQLLHRMRERPAHRATGSTRLSDLLRRAAQVITRRSLVFVVSDFISEPGWSATLGHLAQRHDVIAVRLFDPLEMEIPDIGLVTLQDAESGEQIFVDTNDAHFRRRHAEMAAKQEETLRDEFAHAGVDTLELATDEDLTETLLRFTQMRKLRSRLTAGAPVGVVA